jgi:two-component system, OmpR family, KDP operon response regulator KdpE
MTAAVAETMRVTEKQAGHLDVQALARVLCLTADHHLCAYIARSLTAPWLVIHAADAWHALRTAQTASLTAIIVDVDPSASVEAIALCQRMEASTACPIIALLDPTKPTLVDRVFAAGARDYCAKPLNVADLRYRLTRFTQHSNSPSAGVSARVQYQDLTIDLAQRQVWRNGELVPLTPTEWRLLHCLVTQAGLWVSSDVLLRQVWEGNFQPHPNSVPVYIQRLRHKIEADPACPQYILTSSGYGYQFPAPARRNGQW